MSADVTEGWNGSSLNYKPSASLLTEVSEKFLKTTKMAELEKRVRKLEKEIQDMEKKDDHLLSVSDSAAKEVLMDEINRLKKKGIQETDVIDLHFSTNLPIEQLGRLMDKLESEGIVKEDESEWE